MARNRLTDRKLHALRRKGKRYDVMDTDVPGFGVRVSEIGQEPSSWLLATPAAITPRGEPSGIPRREFSEGP